MYHRTIVNLHKHFSFKTPTVRISTITFFFPLFFPVFTSLPLFLQSPLFPSLQSFPNTVLHGVVKKGIDLE